LNTEQHKFTLRFLDENLEREYWTQKNDTLKKDVKNGLIQSLFLWTIAAGAFYFTNPTAYTHLAIVMLATVFPVFLAMIILIQKEQFKNHVHTIAVLSNVVAAALILFIGYQIPNKLYPVLVAIIFAIFFGLYLYRFTKVATLIIVLSYCFLLALLILTFSHLEAIDLTLAVVYCINVPIFAISASHASEKKERELFVYQKLISIERDRSDSLLLNILPTDIAARLKEGERTIADNYNQVTVLFADIVGFTPLSGKLEPEKLVHLLNHIFSNFDRMAEQYDLEKIKTIGDAYMIVGGLKTDSSGAEDIARLALDMNHFFEKDPLIHQFDLQIRVGFHTGPVTAGVIGLTKFSFDLWGDTVNTASRMESSSEPGRINVSEHSKKLLEDNFKFEPRRAIEIKGKGQMTTFFLISDAVNNT
jgi:class 3 adenylate cyclase/small basic protein